MKTTFVFLVSALVFQLAVSAATQTFSINVGAIVSNGVPQTGAGNIENPGDEDQYTFTGEAGEVIYLDSLGYSNDYLYWDLRDPDGTLLGSQWISGDLGRFELTKSGGYQVRVYSSGYGDATGTYSFKLWGVTDDSFVLQYGDTVTAGFINATAADGAGNIEQPGTYDLYTFTGAAGEVIYLDSLGYSNDYLAWDLRDPDGTSLKIQWINGDLGEFTLTKNGTYQVRVYSAYGDHTGTYSFTLTGPSPPTAARLSYFRAAWAGESSAELTWGTLAEFDTLGYRLDRATADGEWERVTPFIIPCQGTGHLPASYRFDDSNAGGAAKYRLVQIDLRGQERVLAEARAAACVTTALDRSSSELRVTIRGTPGASYAVETTAEVATGAWVVVQTVRLDDAGMGALTLRVDNLEPVRFYRIWQQ